MKDKLLSVDEIEQYKRIIESMSHIAMARIYRSDAPGSVYFDRRYPLYDLFMKRFNRFGGMTVSISKLISWDKTGARR